MASFVYNNAKGRFADGLIDWGTTALKVMLVKSGYGPSVANADDVYVSTASASEISAPSTGYVGGFAGSGRKTLAYTTDTARVDNANDRAKLDGDDVTWSAITCADPIYAAVIIQEASGADASSFLIAYIDFITPITTNGGDLTIQWSANGIITLT